ncbi:hypothetical protein [Leptospira levettii]|uniref:hypothetical protein n=1 Tax=Leptospira levettii TaxID=2023178 RepID=UPI001FAF3088|nr:hypothetical protein [Leptospira levettii]
MKAEIPEAVFQEPIKAYTPPKDHVKSIWDRLAHPLNHNDFQKHKLSFLNESPGFAKRIKEANAYSDEDQYYFYLDELRKRSGSTVRELSYV